MGPHVWFSEAAGRPLMVCRMSPTWRPASWAGLPVSTKLTRRKGRASVSARCACMPMCTTCPVVSASNERAWLGGSSRVYRSPAATCPPHIHGMISGAYLNAPAAALCLGQLQPTDVFVYSCANARMCSTVRQPRTAALDGLACTGNNLGHFCGSLVHRLLRGGYM